MATAMLRRWMRVAAPLGPPRLTLLALQPVHEVSSALGPLGSRGLATKASVQGWQELVQDFARRAGSEDGKTLVTKEEVSSLVEICAANDRHREAVDVIRKSEKLGVHVPMRLRVLVCCSVARKRGGGPALERMKELATQFPKEFKDARVYDPLLSVFQAKNDYNSVHAAVAQMHELNLTPHLRAIRVLMVTAGVAGNRDAVIAAIDFVDKKFPESKHDVATMTAKCQALVKVGEAARVMAIYRSLDSQWLEQHATTRMYNQFLVAAIESTSKQADKQTKKKKRSRTNSENEVSEDLPAWRLVLDQMRASENAQPDDFSFAKCLFELERCEEWGQVLEMFNDLQEHELRTGTRSVNALACSVVIRALYKIDAVEDESAADDKSSMSHPKLPRHRKKDLQVVLKKLPGLNLSNLAHASTLIDTLDEFRLFTPARQIFERLVREGVIREHPWRQKDGYEIDLHTFSRGVAKCAVVFALEDITKTHRGLITTGQIPDDLRIITGVGRRSQEYMVPVIKREITALLTRSSRPALWPSTHPTNPGVLLVRHNALRKWLLKDGHVRYF